MLREKIYTPGVYYFFFLNFQTFQRLSDENRHRVFMKFLESKRAREIWSYNFYSQFSSASTITPVNNRVGISRSDGNGCIYCTRRAQSSINPFARNKSCYRDIVTNNFSYFVHSNITLFLKEKKVKEIKKRGKIVLLH